MSIFNREIVMPGPKAKTFYALEGAVSNAGYGVSWLKDNMLLNTDIAKKPSAMTSQSYYGDSAVLSSYNSSSTIFDSANISQKTDVVFGKANQVHVVSYAGTIVVFQFQCHHLAAFIPRIGSTTLEV